MLEVKNGLSRLILLGHGDVSSNKWQEAVVVAQVVEQWHSVQASQVLTPGQSWLGFYRFRIAVHLFSLGIRLFLNNDE